MKFSRKINVLLIALAAGAFVGALATQDCVDVFDTGPEDDLPELSVPVVLTEPVKLPERIVPPPGAASVPLEPERPCPIGFSRAALPSYSHIIPLQWRFNNPARAPPA